MKSVDHTSPPTSRPSEEDEPSERDASDPRDAGSETYPPVGGDAVILTGPTAGGKSSLAMAVAERIGGEIISVDSIAVYREMDIGTAKPTAEQRRRVRHHLIDVALPSETYSVAMYLRDAWAAIRDIRRRGRIPLLVGGTPMYLKGLLHGFDPGPAADWAFRRAVEEDLARHGPEMLHRRLRQVDPLSAHRLPPSDIRRITRALEVAYLTGRPISHRQTQFDSPAACLSGRCYVLHYPREVLHRRIERRVKAMFDAGLVDEVERLLQRYGTLSRTAAIAVGYREVLALLRGEIDRATAIEQVIAHTRQLARRQETWFRSLPELKTIRPDPEGGPEDSLKEILEGLGPAVTL